MPGAEDSGGRGASDKRHTWMYQRVQEAFKHVKEEKISKAWKDTESLDQLEDFLNNPETRMVLVYSDNITVSTEFPKKFPKGKVVYFLKSSPVSVPTEDPGSVISFNDLSQEPLEHLEKVLSEVYIPLLSNPRNQVGWGEVTSKEVVDKLHSFLANVSITVGNTKGETCLPLPPVDTEMDEDGDKSHHHSSPGSFLSVKDRIHLLEGAVITWTKQIKVRYIKILPS